MKTTMIKATTKPLVAPVQWMAMALVACALVATQPAASAEDASETLTNLGRLIPDTANLVAVIRVQELLNSPMGQTANWRQAHNAAFLNGAATVPTNATLLVRAAHVQPDHNRVVWTLALAQMQGTWTLRSLSQPTGGVIQQVSNHPVVLLGTDAIATQLPGNRLAILSPSSRHDLGRFLRSATAILGGASVDKSWAEEAIAASTSQVVLAIDMRDSFDPVVAANYLQSTIAFAGKPNEARIMGQILSQLETIEFDVDATAQLDMTIKIGFSLTPTRPASELKQVFVNYLDDYGFHIDEIETANATLNGRTLLLKNTISDASLRMVLSLIRGVGAGTLLPESQSAQTPEEATLAASIAYFQTVNQLVDDLYRQASRGRDYQRVASWYDNFARRIDELPIRGVDPDLLRYGRSVSARLRQIGMSLRGVPLEMARVQSYAEYRVDVNPPQVQWNGGWGGWGWGGAWVTPGTVNVETNFPEIRGRQADAIARGTTERETIWKSLNNDRNDVRQDMMKKFNVDFLNPPRR
jgi:hypothetical protein